MIRRRTAVMPVAVRFEFETEADAVAVGKELAADKRARATEIRLADGRTLGFDKYLEEQLKGNKMPVAARVSRADD
jgi:hypothetical protein